MSEELKKPISLVLVLVRGKRPCLLLFYKKSLSSDFVAMETQRHRLINPSPNYLIHSEPSMKQPAHIVWQYNIRVKKTYKWYNSITIMKIRGKTVVLKPPQCSCIYFSSKWQFINVPSSNVNCFENWLSKVIPWLRLLRLVIGLKDSRQFFNQWEAKPKPIAPCTRYLSRA